VPKCLAREYKVPEKGPAAECDERAMQRKTEIKSCELEEICSRDVV